MSEEVEYVPDDSINLSLFITGLIKHIGAQSVPVAVFEGLNHEDDLLAIDLNHDTKEVQFHLVDPTEVTYDESNPE